MAVTIGNPLAIELLELVGERRAVVEKFAAP